MPKRGYKYPHTEEYLKKWDENKSISQNAKSLGMNYGQAALFKRVQGLKALKKSKRRQVISEWNEKETIAQNANRLGVTYSYAGNIKNELGLKCISVFQKRRNGVDVKKVVDFVIQNGMTMADCGRLFRVSRQRIEQIYKDVRS